MRTFLALPAGASIQKSRVCPRITALCERLKNLAWPIAFAIASHRTAQRLALERLVDDSEREFGQTGRLDHVNFGTYVPRI